MAIFSICQTNVQAPRTRRWFTLYMYISDSSRTSLLVIVRLWPLAVLQLWGSLDFMLTLLDHFFVIFKMSSSKKNKRKKKDVSLHAVNKLLHYA